MLRDPSFDEEDGDAWYSYSQRGEAWAPFAVAPDSDEGAEGLHLRIRSEEFQGRVYGDYGPDQGGTAACQDLRVDVMPRFLRGKVWLDHWQRGTQAQYYEILLVADAPQNFGLLRRSRVELAIVLGGVRASPMHLPTRKFVFRGPKEPEKHLGQWREFEVDLHEAYAETWKKVPAEFGKLRLRVEARFDSQVDHRVTEAQIDVYFDDLYLGD